jgi:molybdenum cofactor cytidylyltransferase
MGRTKQLLLLARKPVIRHCLDALLDSGIRDILVVIGPQHEEIVKRLRGLPVRIAVNETPNSEMADSLRAGLRALGLAQTGVLVCLSDHPLVSAMTIRAVTDAHRDSPDRIIIPVYGGRRGHPALFPTTMISDIFSGMTLRDIVQNNSRSVRTINVDDEGVLLDLDTQEDYRAMQKKFMPHVS